MVISTLFMIAVFLALPTFIVKFIPGVQDNHIVLNLIEGAHSFSTFLTLYLGGLVLRGIFNEFSNIMAEHKTIHTYELDLPLTVETFANKVALHARCGTNFYLLLW